MIKIGNETKEHLIKIAKEKEIFIEGNVLKLIDTTNDIELQNYVKSAIDKDAESRKKRLEITKKIQEQNDELIEWKNKNEKINDELKTALSNMEKSKEAVLNDLDVLQKKTQYHLIETIVKISLWIICSVGLITTILFGISLFTGVDNKIIESSWSNMFGILLTNSFSIIGTIMGVKYASENNKQPNKKCDCDCKD